MAKIKVKTNLPAAEPPCPPPVPNAAPKTMLVPTDPPRMPLPPPPFLPGACCRPGTTQVVDNVTVISLTPDTIEVTEGTVGGMKAFGIDAKTFEGIGTTGMVPMPKEGDEGKVLTSNGEWSGFVVELPQSDWKQEDSEQPDYIKNKPELATVATTGSYDDLTDKPTIVQSDWEQNDRTKEDYIKNKPELATVATTGSYNDLTDKPVMLQSDWEQNDSTKEDFIKNKPELATVATTGSYNDLKDKPTIVQSDWAQDDDTQEDFIKNKPGVYAGSAAGLVPPGTVDDQEKFLRGDGSWETVITDMPDFIGATETEDGVRGVIPAPQAGDQNKFLCGNGSWADVENTRECTVNEMNGWLDEVDQEANNG